ncbi:ankyrin repeat domain-containing protein [Dactylosporangium sp. NPDC000244]|uniref:ankyrin repeat domain-containing protein n=1 Tax=Dactylosporangium sp. NPDC000244 TaxID=3154365 RepID=UPI0033255817
MEPLHDAESRGAREAGIAVFAGRVILDARPPIGDDELAAVRDRCAGPVPEGLVALWRVSFGGWLDYDLRVELGGVDVPFSCSELFRPGDGYRDLWGWIDHEAEIGEVERLTYLPFGGFEYLDRVYATTAGPDRGSVMAWQQGLPPAWQIRPGDRAGRVADDVHGLFARLALETDPWADGDSGERLRDAVDELGGGLGDKLRAIVRGAVLDWRSAVERGTVRGDARLRRLALQHAAAADDLALLDRLASLGCDLSEDVGSGLTPLDVAVQHGRERTARWLLARDAPATNALRFGAAAVSLDLARDLLARGAVTSLDTVAAAARNEDFAVLELLAATIGDKAALAKRLKDLAQWSRADDTRLAALRRLAREQH